MPEVLGVFSEVSATVALMSVVVPRRSEPRNGRLMIPLIVGLAVVGGVLSNFTVAVTLAVFPALSVAVPVFCWLTPSELIV